MTLYSGKTIEDAIEKGLKELGINKKQAKISVVQEPRSGVLGKFSKDAKVEVIKLTDAELEKKKKLIKFEIIGGVTFFLVALLVIILSESFTSTTSSENNKPSAPETEQIEKTESSAESSTNESGIESSINETQDIINISNNPDFANLLNTLSGSEGSYDTFQSFASKYNSRTIEFDGHIAYIDLSYSYETYIDILIYSGDFGATHPRGPSFIMRRVSIGDFKARASEDDNVHIIATVDSYSENADLFKITPISITPK